MSKDIPTIQNISDLLKKDHPSLADELEKLGGVPIKINPSSTCCYFNPMEIPKDITSETLIERMRDLIDIFTNCGEYCQPSYMLEFLCLKNQLILSDHDKAEILSAFN